MIPSEYLASLWYNTLMQAEPLTPESLRIIRHQLKGPLTVIHGYLSFWDTDTYMKFSPEKQKEFIRKALEATAQLDKMINELLS